MSHVLLSCVGVVISTSSSMATAVDRDVSLAARAGIPGKSGVVCLETSFVYFSVMQWYIEVWSLSNYLRRIYTQCAVNPHWNSHWSNPDRTERAGTKPGCGIFSSQDTVCAGNIVFVTLACLFALERSSSIIMTSTEP